MRGEIHGRAILLRIDLRKMGDFKRVHPMPDTRISQQGFMPEDLAQYNDRIAGLAIDQALRVMTGSETKAR
jgi:hypothetical protein